MRGANPKIKVDALGSENVFEDKGYEYTCRGLTTTILEKAGHEIDFLSVHNAYAPALLGSG